MGVDRRRFLTLAGLAPAAAVVGCNEQGAAPPAPPPIQALRELVLDDVEPAIVFQPLRRKS